MSVAEPLTEEEPASIDDPDIRYEGPSLIRKTTECQTNLVPFPDTQSCCGFASSLPDQTNPASP